MQSSEIVAQSLGSWLARGLIWGLAGHVALRGWRKIRPGRRPRWFDSSALHWSRRAIWPPATIVERLSLQPGLKVVEVGAGASGLTLALAQAIGPSGHLLAIDERSSVIERIVIATLEQGLTQVVARQASPTELPTEATESDLVLFTALFGGLGDKQAAAEQAYRCLRPGGAIAISEFVVDPDYCLASTVVTHLVLAGFGIEREVGNASGYTIIGRKAPPPAERRPG